MAIPSPGSWSRTLGPQRSLFETFRYCQDHSSGALVYHPVPVSLRRPALQCTRLRFPGARVVLPFLLPGLFLAGCGGGAAVEQAGSLTGKVMETDQTWRCDRPVDLDLVEVTIDGSNTDAVHLNEGCTGVIRRLEITGTGGDGVKVHADAHDLEILGGRIDCGPKARGRHQDAIQAMGGTRVTFRNIESHGCANSFMFINWGRKRHQKPEDIVCWDCKAMTNNYSVSVRGSIRSGAVGGSYESRIPPRATAVAIDPVLRENDWTPRPGSKRGRRAKVA